MSQYKQIGEVADKLNINTKTIRYYEYIGLIPEPHRSEAGYRLYTPEDIERLAFILRAKALDFSLEEIREILNLRERGEAPCPYIIRRIEHKIASVEKRIVDLNRMKGELEALHAKVSTLPNEAIASEGRFCRLIEHQPLTEDHA